MKKIARLASHELQLLRGNARTLAIVMIAPLLFAGIVGSVYSTKKLAALPITVIDQGHSALAREITAALLATEPFVAGPCADEPADFDVLAAEGASHVCFVFPPDFERSIKSGKTTRIAVLVDTSNLATGNAAVTAAASVLSSYSVGVDVRKMRLHGVPETRARSAALPVSMQTRTLFNPALSGNYANFLVPGFLAIAVQLAGLLAMAHAGPDAAALSLPAPQMRSAARIHIAVVALFVGAASYVTVRTSIAFFEFPMRGNEWLLAAVIFWFTANLAALGFGISCIAKDALFASQVCAILTMPNFLASGFTWPVFAMPRALQVVAYALPMNPFVFALRKIVLMGAGMRDLGFEFGLLAAWSIAAAGMAAFGASRLAARTPAEATS